MDERQSAAAWIGPSPEAMEAEGFSIEGQEFPASHEMWARHILSRLSDAEEVKIARLVCKSWCSALLASVKYLQFTEASLYIIEQVYDTESAFEPVQKCFDFAAKCPSLQEMSLLGMPALFSPSDVEAFFAAVNSLGSLPSLRALALAFLPYASPLMPVLGRPVSSAFTPLASLTSLRLERMFELQEMEGICELQGLKGLSLFKCDIRSVPDSIVKLKNLELLDISRPPFLEVFSIDEAFSVSDAIGQLSELRALRLREIHSLQELPRSLGNLSNLRELDISGCSRLTSLPQELSHVSTLRVLDVTGCSALLDTNVLCLHQALPELAVVIGEDDGIDVETD